MTTNPWNHTRSASVADDIDFEIKGQELQFLEIELDPGESAVAEAGAMVWKDSSCRYDRPCSATDAAPKAASWASCWARASGWSPAKACSPRCSPTRSRARPASPFPRRFRAQSCHQAVRQVGGALICQKDSFLAAARGVSIGVQFQRKILTGLFGGEGFIMQKLEGDGWVFVQMGGTIVERRSRPARNCTSIPAARRLYPDGRFRCHPRRAGSSRCCSAAKAYVLCAAARARAGWIQSLPFARLAGRMMAAAGSMGGQNRGEGSCWASWAT
jgi:hypothetical protein